MRDRWSVDDSEPATAAPFSFASGLVSLHFLVAAVRRRWRWCVVGALVGSLLGFGAYLHLSQGRTGTITLMLAMPSDANASQAMATDVSLLGTRSVAQEVIEELELSLEPDDLLARMSVDSSAPQVMTVRVGAADAGEAIELAQVIGDTFLEFRARERSGQARAVIEAQEERIEQLTEKIDVITAEYESATSRRGGEGLSSELLTLRAQLITRIDVIQSQIDEVELETDALNRATHVVDEAAVIPRSPLKEGVLAVFSGTAAGVVVALMLVLALAMLSGRLRRREEIARSLGTPVRYSAGPMRWWDARFRSTFLRRRDHLARGLAAALSEGPGQARVVLATVGALREGAYVVGALADDLARGGTSVAVVDLTVKGLLLPPGRESPLFGDPIAERSLVGVHRQDVRVSALGRGAGPLALPDGDLTNADVVITLVELDLGGRVESLDDLADATVLLVRAGSVNAERLRSSAVLLHQAGVAPAFAMLVGADGTDDSVGVPELDTAADDIRRTS